MGPHGLGGHSDWGPNAIYCMLLVHASREKLNILKHLPPCMHLFTYRLHIHGSYRLCAVLNHLAVCSWGFSRQEYWSGFPCPPPGDLPNPGIEPRSPVLQVASLLSEAPGEPKNTGVGSLPLLQGIFLTLESNLGLLHCRQILYQLSYQGGPIYIIISILKRGWKGRVTSLKVDYGDNYIAIKIH